MLKKKGGGTFLIIKPVVGLKKMELYFIYEASDFLELELQIVESR